MREIKNIWVFLLLTTFQLGWSQTTTTGIAEAFDKALNFHYVNRDSAYFYYEKTIAFAKRQDDLESELKGLSYLLNANNNFYDLKNYGHNILRADTLIGRYPQMDTLEMGHYFKDNLLFEKGTYYYKLGDYTTAQNFFSRYYEKLRAIPEKELTSFDIDMMSAIYSYLGLIHRHTGRYEQAEFYYEKDIAWVNTYKDSLEEWQSTLFNTKKLLSQVYEIQNKITDANELLIDALAFYGSRMDSPRYRNNFLTTYSLLARNYIKQGDFDAAISVLDTNKIDELEDNPFSNEIDVIYGDAFLGNKKYAETLHYYELALQSYSEYRQNHPHQDIAKVQGKIAELYLKQKKYPKGLETLKKAFNASGGNIHIAKEEQNPDPDKVFSKVQLLYLLDVKLRLLQGYYEETADFNVQKEALKTSADILRTFDLLKGEFDSKLDKQFLAEKAYPIFHRMLEIAHTAYEKHPSTETFQLALNIAEKNKDFVLLEALRSVQANKYGSVPQKVLDRETQLRAEITYAEKQIFDANETESGFSDKLFALKQEYYGFLDTIKINYPKYHDLKYQNSDLDLVTVRKEVLYDKGTLVSYTMTDDNLYAIVLNDTKENFLKLPFLEVDRVAVREFYRLLSSPTINGAEEKIALLGRTLYDKILKSPLQGFDGDKLTIVPDGELHYLPFDLLGENESYLLTTKSIGYSNSVASLIELRGKKAAGGNKVLAFAPSFTGAVVANSDRQFGKLQYNDDEVSKIDEFFETETVLDQKATLANFKVSSANFNIIHLATHASANDAYPDYSYLAFTKTQEKNNILYIKDLYNTTLNADMVTLSACQTGIGKLQKGQGMLSLSKGFYYAGAKSLVNTLWKINDKSTVKLMEYFYKGLSEGKSKTEALRDAKLEYLRTTDDNLLRHPYYWAAFVVSGDASPIVATHYWWYIGAGVALFVVLFFKVPITLSRSTLTKSLFLLR